MATHFADPLLLHGPVEGNFEQMSIVNFTTVASYRETYFSRKINLVEEKRILFPIFLEKLEKLNFCSIRLFNAAG